MKNTINSFLEDTNEFDHLYKIVLAGDSNVGKSNILTRYCTGEFG